MSQILTKVLLSLPVIPVFFGIQFPAQAVKMAGSFDFTGQSTYCDGVASAPAVSASAEVMIHKIMDQTGNYILDTAKKNTIKFSSPATGNCYGEWESLPINITHVEFGSNWTIKQIQFMGYSDPERNPTDDKDTLADKAYMTGLLNFMNMSGIIYTLLDDDGDQFGTTPNTLDPDDRLSDTTTAMLPKPEDLKISKVPEPISTLGLLAFGTLGAASTLKRKQKPSSEKETTKVG